MQCEGMKNNQALIQVCRVSRAGDGDEIQLEITNDDLHLRLALTLEEYGRFISGEGHLPARIVRFNVKGNKA